MASLPVVIFQFALSPYEDWQQLAWTGALIITLAVLALSIAARALAASRKSHERHATVAVPQVAHAPSIPLGLNEKISIRDLNFYYGDYAGAEEHQPVALRRAR